MVVGRQPKSPWLWNRLGDNAVTVSPARQYRPRSFECCQRGKSRQFLIFAPRWTEALTHLLKTRCQFSRRDFQCACHERLKITLWHASDLQAETRAGLDQCISVEHAFRRMDSRMHGEN